MKKLFLSVLCFGILGSVQAADIIQAITNSTGNYTSISAPRNIIMNGEMRFNQRYELGKATPTTAVIYTLDRWACYRDTGTFTIERSTVVPTAKGFINSLKVTQTNLAVSGATSTIQNGSEQAIFYRIEGPYIQNWNFGTPTPKTLSLSFWVRSSITGNYSIALKNFGNGTSFVSSYPVTAANTWEYKAIQIPGDNISTNTWTTSVSSRGAQITIDLGHASGFETVGSTWVAGSKSRIAGTVMLSTRSVSAAMYFTGFQLEVSSKPTNFEFIPYDMELYRLRRYFRKSYPIGVALGTLANPGMYVGGVNSTNSGIISSCVGLNPQMRATPSATFYRHDSSTNTWTELNNSDGNANFPQMQLQSNSSEDNFCVRGGTMATVGNRVVGHWSAEAEVP